MIQGALDYLFQRTQSKLTMTVHELMNVHGHPWNFMVKGMDFHDIHHLFLFNISENSCQLLVQFDIDISIGYNASLFLSVYFSLVIKGFLAP